MTICSSDKSYHPLQEQGDDVYSCHQNIMDKRASPINLNDSTTIKQQNTIITPFYHHQQQDRCMNVPATSSSSFIPFEIPTSSSSQYQYSAKKIVFNNQYQQPNNNSLGRPITLLTTRPYKKYKHSNTTTLSEQHEAPLQVEGLPKRYSCTVCGKKFVRPSSLTTHTYSHTGEKPFQCPVERCGRRFSVISNLRRHGKVHSSPTNSNTTKKE